MARWRMSMHEEKAADQEKEKLMIILKVKRRG